MIQNQKFIDKLSSSLALISEIENGKKIVELLKSWEQDGLDKVAIWDDLSSAQKDVIFKEFLRRTTILYGRFSDYLITQSFEN